MSTLAFPIIGCGLLLFFIIGIVCGVQFANGRTIPWRARNRHQAAAEALTSELERLRAELAEMQALVIPGRVEETPAALPEWTNPAGTRRASHRAGR
jgi:hypothetical protein